MSSPPPGSNRRGFLVRMSSVQDKISSLILDSQYGEAFRLCDQIVRAAKKRDRFFQLAGAVSLLGLGHIRQAEEWTEQVEFTEPEFFYIDAQIHLHAGRTAEALLCYTRIIDADPSDTFADRLIEKLRAEPEEIIHEVGDAPLERFLPLQVWFSDQGRARHQAGTPIPSNFREGIRKLALSLFSRRMTLIFLSASGAAIMVLALIFVFYKFYRGPLADLGDKLPEPPAQGTIIPMSQLKDVDVRFKFDSRKEVIDQYVQARQKIIEGRVNEARLLLNEIELSNAGFEIKERSSLLKQMIPYIPPGLFQDNVEIQKIVDDPDLYQGVQVVWPGTIEKGSAVLATAGGKAHLVGTPTNVQAGKSIQVSGFFEKMSGGLPTIIVREIE